MKQMWQMWEAGLADRANDLDAICDQYPIQQAAIGDGAVVSNEAVRRSQIRWVEDDSVKSVLWQYAQAANRNAFGFDVNYLQQIQHTTYNAEDEGHYDWHHDTFWGNNTCYDRKITVIIQLSDAADYEGGRFEIDPQYEQPPAIALATKGTVFAFPSFIPHKVTPVTSGIRKSIVCWVEGPKFR